MVILLEHEKFYNPEARPQGYKTFSILNSAEHKIYPAIVDILTFISMINTTSERLKARNFSSILVFMSSRNFMLS